MFFQFNNKTNGAYSDNEIYWCILGFDPDNGRLCYVDKDGNLIPATTGLNTISKGDRMCADVYYTLAEKDYVYMPLYRIWQNVHQLWFAGICDNQQRCKWKCWIRRTGSEQSNRSKSGCII